MSLTKKESSLLGSVLLLLFVLSNLLSHFVMKQSWEISVFDEGYALEQSRFVKIKGAYFVHPFYGLNSATAVGFQSDVSVENNFQRVSSKPVSGEIKVLVLGGSVAGNLSFPSTDIEGPDPFARLLNERFGTDRFVVYNAAFGGGKQPQQYFKYLYLDLLGFSPDVIINYDGFNEVALPFGENIGRSLNAIYPQSFDRAVQSTAASGSCIGLNNWMLSHNSYLPVYELIKWIYVKRCHEDLTGFLKEWQFVIDKNFELEKAKYLQRVLNIWSFSSNKLAAVADERGIPYIHVIQPNQYLKNSKPFSKKEVAEYLNYAPYKDPIELHYQKLSLDELLTANRLDQRWIFIDEIRTVYSDNCCHFNKLGMETIISDILDNFEPVFESLLSSQNVF